MTIPYFTYLCRFTYAICKPTISPHHQQLLIPVGCLEVRFKEAYWTSTPMKTAFEKMQTAKNVSLGVQHSKHLGRPN